MGEPIRIGTNLDDAVDALRSAAGYVLVVMDRRGEPTLRTFVEAPDKLDFITMSGGLQIRIAKEAARWEWDEVPR